MTAQTRIEALSLDQRGIAGRIAIGMLLALLLYHAVLFISGGIEAILFPWEMDYGEGIVWQQMRWIFTGKAYGPIDQFPAIVFHYPPLYHAVTAITAGMLGTDELATGRAISLLSTLAAAVASAMLVGLLLEGRASKRDRRLGGFLAGLFVFTFSPVVEWALLMRVDMLAIALSLFGLLASFRALAQPRFIWLASLLFVAAVYTKQTAIAAPVATFAVLVMLRPRLAVQGIAICLAVGIAALLTLGSLTDGGFYRHIVLYNVNRPDPSRLWWILYVALGQATYVLLAGFVLFQRLAEVRSKYHGAQNLRLALGGNVADTRSLIAIAYLLISTLMLVLVAKSGSSINYFLEWFFALGLFAAMVPIEAGRAVRGKGERKTIIAIGIPIALAIEVATASAPLSDAVTNTERTRDLSQLSAEIASSAKPVISDDMVLLIRSRRDVLWEPAIFAELAGTGSWDERPFAERIRNGEFAFFITWGQRGDRRFDERYNPAVADAMDSAYPVKEETAGGLIVHRQRAQSAVEKAPDHIYPAPALRVEPTQR